MSLTRKFLASKGIDAAVIDEIITAHTETVSGLKDDLDKANDYKAKADKLDAVEKELNDLKAEVAKHSGEDYAKLKKEYDDYKADVEKKATRAVKEAALKEVLKDAGIQDEKHLAKVIKYSDIDGIELDEKGKVKDAKKKMDEIKQEWPEYIATNGTQGANTATPPSNNGNSGFANMSLSEKMAYANANPMDPSVQAWLASDLTVAPKQNDEKK